MTNHVEIFPWDKNFETGIAIIDEQHQHLVHLINRLASHATDAQDGIMPYEAFQELSDYVEHHFRTEEKIMLDCFGDDPAAAKHLHAHSQFESTVQSFQEQVKTRPWIEILEEIISFLVHWLALHILDSDKRMSKVVLAVQRGLSFSEAKRQAQREMSGSARVLVETILSMYDQLSSKTLQLMKEIINRQKIEQRLHLAGKAIENSVEAIFITDKNGTLIDMNPSFCAMVGHDMETMLGQNIRGIHPSFYNDSGIWLEVAKSGHWSGESSPNYSESDPNSDLPGGWLNLSAIKNDADETTHYVGIFSNISQLLNQHKDLRHTAHHDALTGLPNRILLLDRLSQEVKSNQRKSHEALAVLFIDLDGFKTVNDTFGHDAGDALLVHAAQKFSESVRASDTVARLGGDEFVILLPHLRSRAASIPTLDRLLNSMQTPLTFKGNTLHVTLSIGVAICPDDSVNIESLLKFADKAMYKSKQSNKNQYCFYTP